MQSAVDRYRRRRSHHHGTLRLRLRQGEGRPEADRAGAGCDAGRGGAKNRRPLRPWIVFTRGHAMTEAYICDAVRTPIGRFSGALSAVRPDDLAAIPIAALLARNPKIDPAAIDDVFFGCANQAG